jgi:phospholipid transport system transporter-binding protein
MLVLPADLVQATARPVLQVLLNSLAEQGPGSVVVDASGLTRFDSTALAVCLQLIRVASKAGQTLVWQAIPERLASLARLYGIAELLPAQA